MEIKCSVDLKKKKKYYYNFLFKYLLINILTLIFLSCFFESTHILKVSFGLFGITSIWFVFPLLILYLNYMKYNKNDELIIRNGIELTLYDRKNKQSFRLNDIEVIEIHLPITLYQKRTTWLYWDELFYYNIIFKNGNTYPISCLLCDFIDDLPKYRFQKIKRFFPIIKKVKKQNLKIE